MCCSIWLIVSLWIISSNSSRINKNINETFNSHSITDKLKLHFQSCSSLYLKKSTQKTTGLQIIRQPLHDEWRDLLAQPGRSIWFVMLIKFQTGIWLTLLESQTSSFFESLLGLTIMEIITRSDLIKKIHNTDDFRVPVSQSLLSFRIQVRETKRVDSS